MNNKYKLLALDMDGTLLDSGKNVTPKTLDFLRRISKRGVTIALATGRGFVECKKYFPELVPAVSYGLLNSAAIIFDLAGSLNSYKVYSEDQGFAGKSGAGAGKGIDRDSGADLRWGLNTDCRDSGNQGFDGKSGADAGKGNDAGSGTDLSRGHSADRGNGAPDDSGSANRIYGSNILAVQSMPREAVAEFIRTGLEMDAMVHIHTPYGGAAMPHHLKDMAPFHMEVHQPMFDKVCTPVDDILGFAMGHMDEVLKVCLYCRSTSIRQAILDRVKGLNLELVYAEETSLESTAVGISKGSGILKLCERLNISPSEVVAVGDAPNDLSMLKIAGMPVAMGNASAEIKEVCRRITLDNDSDGIAALEDLLF